MVNGNSATVHCYYNIQYICLDGWWCQWEDQKRWGECGDRPSEGRYDKRGGNGARLSESWSRIATQGRCCVQ